MVQVTPLVSGAPPGGVLFWKYGSDIVSLTHVSRFFWELRMDQATAKQVVLKDPMEIQWVQASLMRMRESLKRGKDKEITGSEIWHLRGREIEALNVLLGRF